MKKQINKERVLILLLVISSVFIMVTQIRVTTDINQRMKELTEKLEIIQEKSYNLEQQNSFLEERVNLLTEAFKDIKK